MTDPAKAARAVPEFVAEWRAGFGVEAFGPLDYLNQDGGAAFTVAAQWLFCPDFTEYRGCLLVVKDGLDGDLAEHEKAAVDAWLEHSGGDGRSAEAKANLLNLAGLFASTDLEPYEADLAGLAESVGACWRGLLAVRFPERPVVVEVFTDGEPEVTFYRA